MINLSMTDTLRMINLLIVSRASRLGDAAALVAVAVSVLRQVASGAFERDANSAGQKRGLAVERMQLEAAVVDEAAQPVVDETGSGKSETGKRDAPELAEPGSRDAKRQTTMMSLTTQLLRVHACPDRRRSCSLS